MQWSIIPLWIEWFLRYTLQIPQIRIVAVVPPPKKLAAEHPLKPPYLVKKIVSTKLAQYWHLWLGNEVVYVTSGFLKRVWNAILPVHDQISQDL